MLHADDANMLQLNDGVIANVDGVALPVAIDNTVPRGCAWIDAAQEATATLPPYGSALTIGKRA